MTTPEGATAFQRSLGLRWIRADVGVSVEMDIRDDLRGPAGSLEGGVVSTLIDVAAGSAAAMAMSSLVATADMTVHFLAPGRVGPVRATGVPLRAGNGNAVIEVRVVDHGRDDRLMAVALVNMRALADRAIV
jgi:uncharacterized protein (TIGR00369 family)